MREVGAGAGVCVMEVQIGFEVRFSSWRELGKIEIDDDDDDSSSTSSCLARKCQVPHDCCYACISA